MAVQYDATKEPMHGHPLLRKQLNPTRVNEIILQKYTVWGKNSGPDFVARKLKKNGGKHAHLASNDTWVTLQRKF